MSDTRRASGPTRANQGGSATRYEVRNGGIVWVRPTKDGTAIVPLANFQARIEAEVVRDNGVDLERRLRIVATLAAGRALPAAVISAAEFPGMSWVIGAWGAEAIVYAGNGRHDHLRAAIQLQSGAIPTERRYMSTGWHRLADGSDAYLHAGGAIGVAGPRTDVAVELEGTLAHFRLPDPGEGDERREAIRASLHVLDLGPDVVTVPLFAGIWRAPLGGADFALHLAGSTGVGKTELAALAQQHFGAEMDARNLPGTWESTANANEELAFLAKDALVVIDDFTAGGSATDAQRRQREADRLIRAQGNRAGRQRMRADTSLRAPHPPRGLILSTGEDVPRGASLRARMLVLELGAGELRWDALDACKRDARDGRFASAMADFVAWLAPRYRSLRESFRQDTDDFRDQLGRSGGHARTPGAVAELAVALHHFLRFAQDAGALSPAEVEALWTRCAAALAAAAAGQAEQQAASNPAIRFAELLAGAVASGTAHVSALDGSAPPNGETWGWQRAWSGDGPGRPGGPRIGWLDDEDLYLEPESSLRVARQMAEGGEGFSLTPRALHRALEERGDLVSAEGGRLTPRRALGGVRRRVLHVRRSFLCRAADAVQAVPAVRAGPVPPKSGPLAGPLAGVEVECGPEKRSADVLRGPDGPHGPVRREERQSGEDDARGTDDGDPTLRAERGVLYAHRAGDAP